MAAGDGQSGTITGTISYDDDGDDIDDRTIDIFIFVKKANYLNWHFPFKILKTAKNGEITTGVAVLH